jgi:diacylglycerol O-acyltransferase / wax synthase
MRQQHGDRLTAVDASFLAQEGPTAHMHVGAVMIFEGPAPAYDDVADHVRSRLHLVPRFRQKLAFPPLETGRPVWVDDPSFNLEYHVRDTALPAPGTEKQLRALAARVHSQALDRSKPLWEMWLVHGLDGGRFALLTKTHHALVDGVSGIDLATVLFDLQPTPAEVEHSDTPWQPRPTPSGIDMAARGVRGLIGLPFDAAARAVGAAAHPGHAIAGTREALEGIGEVVWAGLNPAPETPLNVEIGPHRRLMWVRHELADFKRVKDAFGGTVNDVVLAVVAGALQKWLRSRGLRTEGLELRALVPVSIRARDEHHSLGNRLAAMRAPLPVYVEDPVARLRVVRRAMDGLKESKQAVGAEVLAGMQALAPPTILAQASRLNFSTRLFNLLVTNVPGPQFPLYVLGRRLQDLFPVAFLPKNHALAVAIMSYEGGMDFGLLADYDAMPDLEQFAGMVDESVVELVTAAAAEQADPERNGKGRVSSRARTSRPRTSSRATTEA